MKAIITLIFCIIFAFAYFCSRPIKDYTAERHIKKQDKYIAELENCIRNIGETQQQLIDAGYEWVIIDGNEAQLTVDYKWGPITDRAYGNYKYDEAITLMSGDSK